MNRRPATRALASVLIATLAWTHTVRAGDLNTEVNNMFNNLGAVGNLTEPGAFRGQAMNTFSGGGLMMRVPNKRYQLQAFTFDPPSFKGSCSGIDIHGGSLSIISADELKDMLEKITSALPGLAFQLAVEAISPQFGGLIKTMKDLESKYTLGSKSSCEMATMLVGKAADQVGYKSEAACRELALMTNNDSDYAAATERCKGVDKASILATASTSSDPEIRDLPPFTGNLAWEALKQSADLDDNEREIIMSMVGTIIYDDAGKAVEHVMPTITKAAQLLYGDATAAPGAGGVGASASVKVKLLHCDEPVACKRIRAIDYNLVPFSKKVQDLMTGIVEKIENRTAPTAEEIGFVNAVSAPVYRMLSIATYSKDRSPVVGLMNRYGDMIAAEYAYNFIDQYMRIGIQALSQNNRIMLSQIEQTRTLQLYSRSLLQELAIEKNSLYAKAGSVDSMTTQLEQLARQLRTQNASEVLSMLGRKTFYAK